MKTKIRLGYWDKSCTQPLSYPGHAHGLLCSPTRGGKFRDILCQILLSFPGSCFVIDPKGQAAAVTARYRRDVLKQDVYLLNPFSILPDHLGQYFHAQYDPVASKLDPQSETFAADSDNLVEGLMPHGGPEVHWVDSARIAGSGASMYLREACNRWSLPDVYATISDRHFYRFCDDAIRDGASEDVISRLSRFAGDEAGENREIRSVVSTAITKLSFLGNKPIANNMRKSTVDFREMKRRPMTVYVIPPSRYLRTASAWTRAITNSWADSCLEEGAGKVPVLGILDEFKLTVGNLSAIDTLNALGAGHGCQLISVIQDLNQLKELYPHSWETYIANSGFQIYFAPRDWTSSDYVSRMTGTTEVRQMSKSTTEQNGLLSGFRIPHSVVDAINQHINPPSDGGGNINISQQSRRLLLPEEVRDMPGNEMLVFAEGVRGVIRAGRRPYYESPEYEGLYSPDPYHS